MIGPHIPDEEILYRRIPTGNPWFEPPDRISTYNFKLRKGESGLSVYRSSVISAQQLLVRPEAIPGSRIAWANAGAIRTLHGRNRQPLHLDGVSVGEAQDPGQAEIRGPQPGKLSPSASLALRDLFRLMPENT